MNRVGDAYLDQLELTGHAARASDLDLLAALGVHTVRYPVLWERVERDGWAWFDERLVRLRELGLDPIVGLVHHGSGPPHTSLLDPGFATGLARFAAAVAERYPWVERFTPVNEPLTTARFSCLYGHWYPHARDDRSFVRALLNQCRATVLAMRAIREVRPDAKLVQTEDLAKVHATPELQYQAAFENERRWASLDLLCGRLHGDRPFARWVVEGVGLPPAELEWFEENPCPPDVIGLNHYLSGERFLDHRLDLYPLDEHGGNGRHAYADVLAARILAHGPEGPGPLLEEAWQRFGIPLAVTEAHNSCTREEQLRWLQEVWDAAVAARAAGADVRAVTVWAAFGAVGWDRLVTRAGGRYDPGLYDVRGPRPRATALAAHARTLAAGDAFDHPALDGSGWWRRDERLWYPPFGAAAPVRPTRPARELVIVGARGTLGRAFARMSEARGLAYRLVAREEVDIADAASVEAALGAIRPWAVVNAAGYVRVDEAESDGESCRRENTEGPRVLAESCARRGVAFVTFSSDLVFDGTKRAPYVESDPTAPLSAYGVSKADAERLVLEAMPGALVVRTSAFFGPWDGYNFVTLTLEALARGDEVAAAADVVVSPTYVPDLVEATLDLLLDAEAGIWHLANPGETTWFDFARAAAAAVGADAGLLDGRSSDTLPLTAPRPPYSVLGSERGMLLPRLDDALERYVAARAA